MAHWLAEKGFLEIWNQNENLFPKSKEKSSNCLLKMIQNHIFDQKEF